ncbi:MAG: hypothetical protein ACHQUC_07895 [Chlamydiales bacterium]
MSSFFDRLPHPDLSSPTNIALGGIALLVCGRLGFRCINKLLSTSKPATASVLPYVKIRDTTTCPETHQVYFLIGKGSRLSFTDGTWCDFGGSRDWEEDDVYTTAAIRASKESDGLLGEVPNLRYRLQSCPEIVLKKIYRIFPERYIRHHLFLMSEFKGLFYDKKLRDLNGENDEDVKERTLWIAKDRLLKAVEDKGSFEVDGVQEKLRPSFLSILQSPETRRVIELIDSPIVFGEPDSVPMKTKINKVLRS